MNSPTPEQVAAAIAEEQVAEAFVIAQWKTADEYLAAEWPGAIDDRTRAIVRSAWTELARRHDEAHLGRGSPITQGCPGANSGSAS